MFKWVSNNYGNGSSISYLGLARAEVYWKDGAFHVCINSKQQNKTFASEIEAEKYADKLVLNTCKKIIAHLGTIYPKKEEANDEHTMS